MFLFRYYTALSAILVVPVLLFWMVVHPFVAFWRRLGPLRTYSILGAAMLAGGLALYHYRDALLAVDFGENPSLQMTGAFCVVASGVLRKHVGKSITLAQIVGVPEIDPQRRPGALLTHGIYSHIRHPRYVQVLLVLAGVALLANFPASYAASALWLPGLWIIIALEEKELADRFGAAYHEYRGRVPAFIPRLKR